jgi:hypothetical protein
MVIGSTRKTPLGKAAALYFIWIELSHSEIKVYTILGGMTMCASFALEKAESGRAIAHPISLFGRT